MPLTVCPLSNVKLCVYSDLGQHALKHLLDAGLAVTINSDDPAYFGGYVGDNYVRTAQAVGLTRDDIVTLAKNSFTGSFLDVASLARHIAAVDAFMAAN
jgi:adenosine deaminase